MLRILCLVSCALLMPSMADPGALLKLGMEFMNKAVKDAMTESQILEKMAAMASQKQAGVKSIKSMTDMKVKEVTPPIITLDFLPGVGIFQCVSTRITITGKSFMGGTMEIIVVVNITATNRLQQDEATGLPMFQSEGCQIVLVSVKTNLPSKMLPKVVNKFLDSTLKKVLPGMMCPAIDTVLEYVNQKWTHLMDPMPVGEAGSIKYILTGTPTTTASYIEVDFSPVVQREEGDTIALPEDGAAITAPEDYPDGSSQLVLSAAFFTAEFTLLQKYFDVDIKGKTIGKLPPHTTKTLSRFVPRVGKAYRKSLPLMTQIRISKPPKDIMKPGKSQLHLHGTIEMFAIPPKSGPSSMFVLEIRFSLDIQYSLSEDKVHMVTSMNKLLDLSVVSSSIRPFKEKKLKIFLTSLLQEAYVPVINGALEVGFPLPDFLGTKYGQSELAIVENALVVDLRTS
ncbi:BPI fold-containing family B member 6 [Phascolarctos cinereus]|uniref:BPI fold-containing family B member 6 n=1 Tax=Phascolarctos cinereus TaxID=38626 RepID=A0A6P5KNJ5_PHACI|nr:BPI fold-containing family B member 6 [Phascolarctos cinereus]